MYFYLTLVDYSCASSWEKVIPLFIHAQNTKRSKIQYQQFTRTLVGLCGSVFALSRHLRSSNSYKGLQLKLLCIFTWYCKDGNDTSFKGIIRWKALWNNTLLSLHFLPDSKKSKMQQTTFPGRDNTAYSLISSC